MKLYIHWCGKCNGMC